MKRGRLSLGRRPFNESSNVVEISDDDVTICEATSVSSSMTVASKSNSRHYVLEDSSSDEDVTVDDVPSTFNKSPSLFNWNKTNDMFWNGIKMNFAADTLPCQSNFPESSDSHSSRQVMPTETPNKKQKVMNDWTDDDDEISILDIREKDNLPSQVGIQYELLIAGTKVKFPVKPYSCQKSLVGSLITGCTKEENCLLESPTGSGKTLALLCGALAWQEQYSGSYCRSRCWIYCPSAIDDAAYPVGKFDDAFSTANLRSFLPKELNRSQTQWFIVQWYLNAAHRSFLHCECRVLKTVERQSEFQIFKFYQYTF